MFVKYNNMDLSVPWYLTLYFRKRYLIQIIAILIKTVNKKYVRKYLIYGRKQFDSHKLAKFHLTLILNIM